MTGGLDRAALIDAAGTAGHLTTSEAIKAVDAVLPLIALSFQECAEEDQAFADICDGPVDGPIYQYWQGRVDAYRHAAIRVRSFGEQS